MSNYQHERGWLDSEVWGDTPYSEREAWSWMIGEANWEAREKNISGLPVMLERGQFSHSLRFMATKFQWSKGKVERFLQKISVWNMIKICSKIETGQNIITICNYDKYQAKRGKSETHAGTGSGTEARHMRGQTINPSIPSNQLEDTNVSSISPPKKQKKSKQAEKPESVPDQLWEDFLVLRKKKNAPVTQTVLNGIATEARKLNWPIETAISEMCQRTWQGFKAQWIINERERNERNSNYQPASGHNRNFEDDKLRNRINATSRAIDDLLAERNDPNSKN